MSECAVSLICNIEADAKRPDCPRRTEGCQSNNGLGVVWMPSTGARLILYFAIPGTMTASAWQLPGTMHPGHFRTAIRRQWQYSRICCKAAVRPTVSAVIGSYDRSWSQTAFRTGIDATLGDQPP